MEDTVMDMEGYFSEVKAVAVEGFKRLNDTTQVEHKKWEVPVGSWDVSVVRGKVLEKATLSHILLNTKNPLTGEDTRFDVVQAKVYPASPKIPILLFNVEYRAAAKEQKFAGMLDVVPVAAHEEDLNFLADGLKKVIEKHGVDHEPLRKKVENIYKMDQWEHGINAGIGIYLDLAKEQLALIKEAGSQWLTSYFTIAEKREKESSTSKEVALMDSARARIMEYYFLGDMSISVAQKIGVPLEALTLGTLAPTIRY
jgi:coproporphyrinogen III oxidase